MQEKQLEMKCKFMNGDEDMDISVNGMYDVEDDYDIDFSKAIRNNPFKDKLKNGYTTIIHYGPKPDAPTDMDIIDNMITRISYIAYDKMRGVPHEQIEEKLNIILEAIKKC